MDTYWLEGRKKESETQNEPEYEKAPKNESIPQNSDAINQENKDEH